MSRFAWVFADVPAGVTTFTLTVSALVGAVALIKVDETTEKFEAALVPKYTAVVAPKPLPMMVTVAPPPADTVVGEIALTTGAAESTPGASVSTAWVADDVTVRPATAPAGSALGTAVLATQMSRNRSAGVTVRAE